MAVQLLLKYTNLRTYIVYWHVQIYDSTLLIDVYNSTAVHFSRLYTFNWRLQFYCFTSLIDIYKSTTVHL